MRTSVISFLICIILLGSCSESADTPTVPKARADIALNAEEIEVNLRVQDFAFDFIRLFTQKQKEKAVKNYIFSPLGISYALGRP